MSNMFDTGSKFNYNSNVDLGDECNIITPFKCLFWIAWYASTITITPKHVTWSNATICESSTITITTHFNRTRMQWRWTILCSGYFTAILRFKDQQRWPTAIRTNEGEYIEHHQHNGEEFSVNHDQVWGWESRQENAEFRCSFRKIRFDVNESWTGTDSINFTEFVMRGPYSKQFICVIGADGVVRLRAYQPSGY